VAEKKSEVPTQIGVQTSALTATSVALGLAIAELAAARPPWAAAAMVGLVIGTAAIFALVLGWSVGVTVLLVVTCLIDRDTFPIRGVNVRPEQIAGLLALLVFAALKLRSNRDLAGQMPDRIELALLIWFAVALASSIVAALNRSDSLKVLALLMVSSLALFLPRRLVADRPEELHQVMRWTLLALAIESGYAFAAYVLHLVRLDISISLNSASGHLNAYGTLWEPNVLGAVAGAGAVAWLLLGPRYFKQAWMGVALCLTACVASFARAAWIAVIIVIVLAVATPIRRRIDLRTLGLGGLAATLLAAWVFVSDSFGHYTIGTAGVSSSVGNSTDLLGRLYQFAPALSDLRQRPILGGGVNSFGQRHIVAGLPEHLGNVELMIANDTGIVGLLVFAVFAAAIVVAVWRRHSDVTVLGFAATTLVIAITNQATETLELMITWLILGLLLAAVDAASATVRSPATAGTVRDTGS
jgi:O-antigen ligase